MDPGIVKQISDNNLDHLKWMLFEMGVFDYSCQDMFNDVILNLYKSVSRPGFRLNCSIDTYFMKIAERQIRFYKYRKQHEQKLDTTDLGEAESISVMPLYEQLFDIKILLEMVKKHLIQLALTCRRILNLAFQGYSNSDIAERMKDENAKIRRKKWNCMDNLLRSMHDDPEFREIRKSDIQFKEEEK